MSSHQDDVLDLIVRWEDARARGESLSAEELCRECPDVLDELRRQVSKLQQVDWLNEPIPETVTFSSAPAVPPTADLALPRMMAERYRLDALIGEGGFGRVYRGFDTWLERPVALKVPRSDRAVPASEIDLCRIEARKVARLRHPNIVPVHDVGRDEGTCFIVSEWIEGVNLADRIRDDPPNFVESARIVSQVADALHHAHRAGFIHRDIKPANIVLDRQGHAYLTDFGIAVLEDELGQHTGTAGTLPYMAPEQLDQAFGPVDHRADLYALGVVLYEALTRRRPFHAERTIALREQILDQSPPSPRSLDPAIPEILEHVCLRCLAKRPDERIQDAEQLAAELRAFLESSR